MLILYACKILEVYDARMKLKMGTALGSNFYSVDEMIKVAHLSVLCIYMYRNLHEKT